MWKTTGEIAWRERGWEIFLAIEKYAKQEHGYASLSAVNSVPYVPYKDETPSYFYAETYVILLVPMYLAERSS